MRRIEDMKRSPLFVTLFFITLPLILVGIYLTIREFDHQTQVALDRRDSIAKLGAMLVHEKFDGIINIGISLASSRLVYNAAEKGNWDEVTQNLSGAIAEFPFIDTVGLFDTDGVFRASIPPIPESVGKSFAYRDYFQGVSKEWKPYVSEAFKREPEPKYNVVSIAVPIMSPEEKPLGVLLLTIKLDTIVGWVNDIEVGPDGTIFIVDKKGQLVAHKHLNLEDDLADYSSFESIQKLIAGGSGVEIHDKDFAINEEHVAAYSHVRDYGFGVEILQPTRTAFAERNAQTIALGIIWVLIVSIVSLSSYFILRSRALMKIQRDRERNMLDSIGDGIVAIDRDWRIILWNKSASVITGWSKEEALGKSFRDIIKFIRESDRKENISFIEDAIVMNRTASMESGMLLVKKDGGEVSVGDSAAPIVGLSGETEGAMIIFRDASKERESTHLKSDFSYASHQLRTPITEALWNLETGIEEQDADKKNEDLRIAHKSLLSVKMLSEHLVSASEIDQGNIAVNLSSVRLVDILTDVQSKLEKEANLRGVTISFAPISPIIAITTDRKLLTKILFEVVENAVIYSHRDSTVTVTATQKGKEFVFEVADMGVGIPVQEHVLMFTKFFRASNHGSENPGDGLGLYLAKAYTTLLGGRTWFESVEGSGTTFFVTIPISS